MRMQCEDVEVPAAGRGELGYRPASAHGEEATTSHTPSLPARVPSKQLHRGPSPSPPEMPLPAWAGQLHSSLSGDLLFFKGRAGREWREQEKTEIAGEREICKCIPGKRQN